MPTMANLRDYGLPVGTAVVNGLINRRAVGRAQQTLVGGVDNASKTISGNNTHVQDLLKQIYSDQSGVLGKTYGDQTAALNPFIDAGTKALPQLESGTADGGRLVKGFNFDNEAFFNDPQIQRRIAEGNKLLARKQASGGSLSSGAALKAARDYNDYQIGNEFGTSYDRAEKTYRGNQDQELNALLKQIGIGETATGQQVQAAGNYGAQQVAASGNFGRQSVDANTGTSQAIADLETTRASAQAAGDVEKANAITDTLNAITGGVQDAGIVRSLMRGGPSTMASLAPTALRTAAAPLPGSTAALTAAAAAGGLGTTTPGAIGLTAAMPGLSPAPGMALGGSLAGASTPAAAGLTAGAAPLTGYAGGGLVTSHGALVGMMTNPVTIVAAAGIMGLTALLKSQAHHEASTWVSGFQNKFDQNMGQLNGQFATLAQSGQLNKGQAVEMRNEVAAAMKAYEQKRQAFARQGKDERKVSDQALKTFETAYGKNGSTTLNWMDSVINGMAA